ncbi:MAG: hypothetical protein R2708_04765 [Vicinamibacterales bacterium]
MRRPVVHAHHAELQALGDAERRGQVVRPHVGGQAVAGAVGERDRLVDAVEAGHRQHRAEDLVAVERRVGREVGDDGGLVEVALVAPVRPSAAGRHARAALAGARHHGLDTVALPGVDERAHLGLRVEAVADAQRADRRRDALREGAGRLLRHQEALRRDAHLTAVPELRRRRAGHDGVEIHVGEDQHRGVAAQFEREPGDCLRRAVHEQLADACAPGEVNLGDGRVGEHRLAHRARIAVHEVDDAGRCAGLVQHARHVHAGERRVLAGTDDDGAAGGQRRAAGAGDVPGREVPRGDEADHAERLLQHDHPLVGGARGNHAAVGALALLGEPVEEIGRRQPLALGLDERLARLLHGGPGEGLDLGADSRRRAFEHRGPLVGRLPAPVGEGAAGGLDGAFAVGRAAVGHGGHDRFGGGVEDVPGAAVGRVLPGTVDELLWCLHQRS